MSAGRRGGALVAAAALGLVALLGASACAKVIGVSASDYKDAVEELCACSPPAFPDPDTATRDACVKRLHERFQSAGPDAYATWLKAYADKGCGDDCTVAAQCFYTAPACAKADCANTEECCGAASKVETCMADGSGAKACRTCTKVGQPCTTDAQCCGATGFAICQKDLHVCIETCSPTNPTNCPGCCQHLDVPGATPISVCVDKTPGLTCAPYCSGPSDKLSCASPTKCAPQHLIVGADSSVKLGLYGCRSTSP